MVAAAGRYAGCHRVQEAARAQTGKYEELLGTIEHLKQQNWLMTTMKSQHRMMKGVSEEIQSRFPKEVLVLEEKFTDAENCSRSM